MMVDQISVKHRSWNMSRIRSRDTAPERLVRSLLHSMGFRFRLHRNDLPGKPDVVLPRYNTVVLVHGCFWHRHCGCRLAYSPKSRTDFWLNKFRKTVERDEYVSNSLQSLGWHVVIVWECELDDMESVAKRLTEELGSHGGSANRSDKVD